MIEFGKDHSPAWLELMSAYQIFRARLFDWSREPDQVKQRDLLLELGSWENRDLNRRTLVADLLRSAEMWDEKALLLVQKELTAIPLQEQEVIAAFVLLQLSTELHDFLVHIVHSPLRQAPITVEMGLPIA